MLFLFSQLLLLGCINGIWAWGRRRSKPSGTRWLPTTPTVFALGVFSEAFLIILATLVNPQFQVLRVATNSRSLLKFTGAVCTMTVLLVLITVVFSGLFKVNHVCALARSGKAHPKNAWTETSKDAVKTILPEASTTRSQLAGKSYLTGFFTLLYGGLATFTALIFFSTIWVLRNFGVPTVNTIRFFLGGNPLDGATGEQYSSITSQVFIPTGLFVLLVLAVRILPGQVIFRPTRQRRPQEKTITAKTTRRILSTLAVLAMAGQVGYVFVTLPVVQTLRAMTQFSRLIDDNFVVASDKNLVFPKKPKNLIHILMESMENSYYSRSEGGYLERSLMPDLAQLTKENVSFSNTEKFGGPYQTDGAGHSIAGIFNMQTGCFMSTPGIRVEDGVPYADFPNLGGLLKARGYENVFMLGANGFYHSMNKYLTKYGGFQVKDLHYFRKHNYVPRDYLVWWGVEDDKLYEFAKQEMTRLGNGSKPFYFMLENADTHNNGGYVSPRMTQKPSDKQYGNVIHYSQAETVKLVRWIQQQPWYKDTVIVISGDHRSKDNSFFVGWDKSYNRTIVNLVINGVPGNPGTQITQNRQYNTFDFFPTTLRALGVQIKGNRLGLGTDLYSGQPTLMERVGQVTLDRETPKRSRFYEKHIAKDLIDSEVNGLVRRDKHKLGLE